MSSTIPTIKDYMGLIPTCRHFGPRDEPVKWVLFRSAAGEETTYLEHMTTAEAVSFTAHYVAPETDEHMTEADAAEFFRSSGVKSIGPDDDRYTFIPLSEPLVWCDHLSTYVDPAERDRMERERLEYLDTLEGLRRVA